MEELSFIQLAMYIMGAFSFTNLVFKAIDHIENAGHSRHSR